MTRDRATKSIYLVEGYRPSRMRNSFVISGETPEEAVRNAYAVAYAKDAPPGTTLNDICLPGVEVRMQRVEVLDM